MDIAVRIAEFSDAEAIAAIYAFHVAHGTASFDSEGPSPGEWADKIVQIVNRGWPFLVATHADEGVVAYAYATQFRDRPAYVHTCENSIYVASDWSGQKIGGRLLQALIDAAANSGFEQMIAVIGGGEPASVALHARLGFVERGRMKDVGVKFGRKLDTVYMQRALV